MIFYNILKLILILFLCNMNLQDRIQDMVNEIMYVLGAGHTKDIYLNAMTIALQDARLPYEINKVIEVSFRNRFVGILKADLIVDHRMILQLSVGEDVTDSCKMYKRISQLPYALMILFPNKEGFSPLIESC